MSPETSIASSPMLMMPMLFGNDEAISMDTINASVLIRLSFGSSPTRRAVRPRVTVMSSNQHLQSIAEVIASVSEPRPALLEHAAAIVHAAAVLRVDANERAITWLYSDASSRPVARRRGVRPGWQYELCIRYLASELGWELSDAEIVEYRDMLAAESIKEETVSIVSQVKTLQSNT